MHPQDTAVERAEDIARELTAYKKVQKAHQELEKLIGNNSILAQALKLDTRQYNTANDRLADFGQQHYSTMVSLINAGVEDA